MYDGPKQRVKTFRGAGLVGKRRLLFPQKSRFVRTQVRFMALFLLLYATFYLLLLLSKPNKPASLLDFSDHHTF